MDAFLGGDGGLRLVPVRLLIGAAPPSQLPIPTVRPDGEEDATAALKLPENEFGLSYRRVRYALTIHSIFFSRFTVFLSDIP